MPLTPGATLNRRATQARVRSWTHGGGQANLSVDLRSIPLDDDATWIPLPFVEQRDWALWNPSRREAVNLNQRSGHGGSSWLVLPGVAVEERGADLEPAGGYEIGKPTMVSDSWLDGAKVVLYEWRARGRYPIRISAIPPR
jgi:hypothetical protein